MIETHIQNGGLCIIKAEGSLEDISTEMLSIIHEVYVAISSRDMLSGMVFRDCLECCMKDVLTLSNEDFEHMNKMNGGRRDE